MKLGDRGTTPDSGTEQTRETMPAAGRNAVPMPLSETLTEGVDGTRSPSALTEERKEDIRKSAALKMDFVQQQYWKLRNGKQDHMMCPYCVKENREDEELCCLMFTKAFRAILERQNQVDIAASHVRNCHKVGLVH